MFFEIIEPEQPSTISCAACKSLLEINSVVIFTPNDPFKKCDANFLAIVGTHSVNQYCWNCYLQGPLEMLLKGSSVKGYNLLNPALQQQLLTQIDKIITQQASARKSPIRDGALSNLKISTLSSHQSLTCLCISVIISHKISYETLPNELQHKFRDYLYLLHERELVRQQMTGVQMKLLLKNYHIKTKGTKHELEDRIILGQIYAQIPLDFEVPIPTSKKKLEFEDEHIRATFSPNTEDIHSEIKRFSPKRDKSEIPPGKRSCDKNLSTEDNPPSKKKKSPPK